MAVAALPAGHRSAGPTIPGLLLRGAVFLAVGWFVFVFATGNVDRAGRATDAVIYALVGLSLNVLIGYTGQLSLGHQAFVGFGAFAAAYSTTELGISFEYTFLISLVVTAVVALLLGLVALRITGLYLALITLVFGLTMEASVFQIEELTGGGAGQPAPRSDYFIEPSRYYYLALGILAAVLWVDWRLTRTKVGRALGAVRENERVAAAFGVNVTAFKLLAFVLSGAIAGLAGALFAYRFENVTGEDFDFFLALTFVLMTVVGGLRSRVGVVIGSAFFALLEYLLETIGPVHSLLEALFGEQKIQFAPRLIGALLLLLTLIFNPGGIAQQLKPITRWLAGGRFTLHGDHDTGPGTVEGSSVRA